MSQGSAVSESWQRAFAWIEAELGGKVVHAERQPRWRPAWFIDLERDTGRLPLYFRGDRGEAEAGVYSLERELRVLKFLEAHEIPVPHVYGFCPAPRGIVMERCPGRADLATAESDAVREAVLDDYVAILARMHRIDAAALAPLGFAPPADARELALSDFPVWERTYRKRKLRPEPVLEFLVQWVRRNVPENRRRASLICSDSGQFLYEGERVTAVIDLELATLGDPLADLAGMVSRDLSEPLGDLSRAFRRYEELSGEPLDRDAIDFHTVRFCAITPLAVAHLVAAPPPGLDLAQYLGWYSVWLRAPLEVIAKRLGVALDPVENPGPSLTRHSTAHDALRELLTPSASPSDPERADSYSSYERDVAARVAEYLRRAERFGPALEARDLDEAAALLGSRPPTWGDADAALEQAVLASGPERDAEWVRLFHRRLQRLEILLAPVMRELEGAAIQHID